MSQIKHVLCADWSRDERKREVTLADIDAQRISRIELRQKTVGALLRHAETLPGPTLLVFDAVLGVPIAFLERVRQSGRQADDFWSWLQSVGSPAFFQTTIRAASDWSVETPFFAVPPGAQGGLRSFIETAGAGTLRREVDVLTGGKSPFIVHGIPGSVGSATRDLWQGLLDAHHRRQPFQLWPFQGPLEVLLEGGAPIVAEGYPRACYATALQEDTGVCPCAPLALAKTKRQVRREVLERLVGADGRARSGASMDQATLEAAEQSEDVFDAVMMAVALLRCIREGRPLHAPLSSPSIEGGILGTGTVTPGGVTEKAASRARTTGGARPEAAQPLT